MSAPLCTRPRFGMACDVECLAPAAARVGDRLNGEPRCEDCIEDLVTGGEIPTDTVFWLEHVWSDESE